MTLAKHPGCTHPARGLPWRRVRAARAARTVGYRLYRAAPPRYAPPEAARPRRNRQHRNRQHRNER